ncbi:MAG: DoxX-like family protein [Chthoniobacteraceae bacterium]
MPSFLHSEIFLTVAGILIAAVWVFHGLYSKILDRIPRHRRIVARILGEQFAWPAMKLIGLGEISLGVWAFTGWHPIACAAVQTAALVAMNTLEILLAGDLLISAVGMVILNLGFIALSWQWALALAARS